jgi:hypothetical protein
MEIRDNIDSLHSNDNEWFLVNVFPQFYDVLRNEKPVFIDGPEQVGNSEFCRDVLRLRFLPCADSLCLLAFTVIFV